MLGTDVLSRETLHKHSDALMVLNRALSETADILLYGCEISRTGKGEAFVAALAELRLVRFYRRVRFGPESWMDSVAAFGGNKFT
ncbi:DUF4347 domain-containing protein [Roseibium alexandrii]|uniref:DUF4347 domain-containing protein n=1 Tax=Roseibium alexandrii TaxID=388408 RepID=UPI0002D32452